MEELSGESPRVVQYVMEHIYKDNKHKIRHIGSNRYGVRTILKGLYTNNGLLYFHIQFENTTNIPFEIDFISFKIVDKRITRRTSIQERVINPVRDYNYSDIVGWKSKRHTVFALPGFTMPDDKQLLVEVHEKDGGRYQSFLVENTDLLRAMIIKDLRYY